MLDILYSNFCAATVLSRTEVKNEPPLRGRSVDKPCCVPLTRIRNVLHDAMHRPLKWAIVLVIMPMNTVSLFDIMHLTESVFKVIPVTNRALIVMDVEVKQFYLDCRVGHKVTVEGPGQARGGQSGSTNLMQRQVEWWTHSTRKVLYLRGARCGMQPERILLVVSLLGERCTDQASAGTPGNGWAPRVAEGVGLLRPQGHDPNPHTVETRL